MLLKVDCLPNAVGKQPSIPLIYLGRKWTLNWWWWWWWWWWCSRSQNRLTRHQRSTSAIVGKICRGRNTQALKHDHTQFVCNALWVWKPMQIHQGRCNVIKALQAKNQTSSRIHFFRDLSIPLFCPALSSLGFAPILQIAHPLLKLTHHPHSPQQYPPGASFQLFLGGAKKIFIFQCHPTIEKLEKTTLYM